MSAARRKSIRTPAVFNGYHIDQQVRVCFVVLLKRVDNVNANEQCFEHLKDMFIAATTDNTTQIVNDNEWIDLVNKLLIKQLKCH